MVLVVTEASKLKITTAEVVETPATTNDPLRTQLTGTMNVDNNVHLFVTAREVWRN